MTIVPVPSAVLDDLERRQRRAAETAEDLGVMNPSITVSVTILAGLIAAARAFNSMSDRHEASNELPSDHARDA